MVLFLGWDAIGRRSQALKTTWVLNGSVLLADPAHLWADRTLLTPDFRPLFMDKLSESIDIDSPSDFECCKEALRKSQHGAE